jgi:hypothetical protein
MEDRAEDVYGKPSVFFENTFPTVGLRDLLTEGLGRVSGKRPNASPIIRLRQVTMPIRNPQTYGSRKTSGIVIAGSLRGAGVAPAHPRTCTDGGSVGR